MRTTLDIDEDVLAAVRSIAETEGQSLGSTLSKLARQGLSGNVGHEESGLPVFEIPADAPVITGAMVKEAQDE